MNNSILTWPERIYLQHGDIEVPEFPTDGGSLEELTWERSNIHGNDVEYVRSDLHAALLARVRELEAEWRPVSERPPNGIYEVYANDGCDSLRRFAEYTNYRGWDVAYIKFWRVPAPLPPFPNTGETA